MSMNGGHTLDLSWFPHTFLHRMTPGHGQCSHWEIIGCEFWPGKASEGQFCELFCKMCIKCEVQKWKMWGFVYESLLETFLPLHKERFFFPFRCTCKIMNYTRLDIRSIGNWKTETTIRILGTISLLVMRGFQITHGFIVLLSIENVGRTAYSLTVGGGGPMRGLELIMWPEGQWED